LRRRRSLEHENSIGENKAKVIQNRQKFALLEAIQDESIAAMGTLKRNKTVRIVAVAISFIVMCPILVYLIRKYVLALWGNLHFINYFVAFIPTILSILFAFVVDKDLEPRVRKRWRIGVVLCGMLYSAALWHQQTLTDQASHTDQEMLLNKAVARANSHADEQFAHVEKDVGSVQSQVQGLGKQIDDTTGTIVQTFNKSASDLSTSIGNVSLPKSDPATLKLSLYKEDQQDSEFPMIYMEENPDKDGYFPVNFFIKNISDTAADSVDIWIYVCGQCSYAAEPMGFDKPAGINEHARHILVPTINPGASWGKITVSVKAEDQISRFEFSTRYSCKTCGKMQPAQTVSISKPRLFKMHSPSNLYSPVPGRQ
jgi:hypothetical protein